MCTTFIKQYLEQKTVPLKCKISDVVDQTSYSLIFRDFPPSIFRIFRTFGSVSEDCSISLSLSPGAVSGHPSSPAPPLNTNFCVGRRGGSPCIVLIVDKDTGPLHCPKVSRLGEINVLRRGYDPSRRSHGPPRLRFSGCY